MNAPTTMTPDEMRVAIAEFCGFTEIRDSEPWECWDDRPMIRLVGLNEDHGVREIPKFPTDLNACAEFEARLTDEQKEAYARALWEKVCGIGNHGLMRGCVYESDLFAVASATALQRCEALCRVLNLKV